MHAENAQNTPTKLELWPSLPYSDWAETCQTVHMWTQIVGKLSLAHSPFANHWWHVPFHLTARGLGSPLMFAENRAFAFSFDFIDHCLKIAVDDGQRFAVSMQAQSVASFAQELKQSLNQLGLPFDIWPFPVELEAKHSFFEDTQHHSYDPLAVHRFWQVLMRSHLALAKFRSTFMGKVSPVHFFWGSFDLAVSRFSGRPAPEHPGAPFVGRGVTREAYSHEVSSCGFWPGSEAFPEAMFYSYVYPEPSSFKECSVEPSYAYYSEELREFILPYKLLRQEPDPEAVLLRFLNATYEAAATCAAWDRAQLERHEDSGSPHAKAGGRDHQNAMQM